MPILAKRSEKKFVPCPAGLHQAVCVDVVDLGLVEVTYSGKTKQQHKVDVFWQVAEINPDNGQRYLTRKRYTLSLDEKANLRKDLESWRGKSFTEAELNGFDLEALLGANAQLNVIHVDRNDETYANVTGIVPLGRGMTKIAAVEYVRAKDRVANGDGAPELTDDDIPF